MTQQDPSNPAREDIERKERANLSLQHMTDLSKQIEARAVAASSLLRPIKERKAQNHYLEEAKTLMDRHRGSREH